MTCDWTPLRQLSLSIVTVCPKTCDFKDESHISGSSTRRLPGSSLFRQDQNHESAAVHPAAQVHKYCPVLGGSVQIGPGLDDAVAMRNRFLQVSNIICTLVRRCTRKSSTRTRRLAQHSGQSCDSPFVHFSQQPIKRGHMMECSLPIGSQSLLKMDSFKYIIYKLHYTIYNLPIDLYYL